MKNITIKKHVFLPSGRKIFTVIGNDEYYVSRMHNFCFCTGFMMHKMKCSHMNALYDKDAEKHTDIIVFSDDEYEGFSSGLFTDMFAKLRLIKSSKKSQGF